MYRIIMEYEIVFMVFISFILSISLVTMLAACLCCRKKVPKNELLGLEGMVKLKNPDDNVAHFVEVISLDAKTVSNENESKRASNAPHRSLPDIPISEPTIGDTGSDLYATVGDKVAEKPQGRSPHAVVKKLASISQHSSLSQADDISSPYARVRSPPHAYDKVKPAEHPYAQLKVMPSTSAQATAHQQSTSNNNDGDMSSRRESNQSLLEDADGHQIIPAASAIAGRISASQELPYMTPPIIQNPTQQNFSGDSQDSSKGYTSISVREPLANIIAQTKQQNAAAKARRRDLTDSHYATVSDDSDEVYAAIDDPNNQGDLYTSGSETYAQIQPPPTALTVSVEINTTPSNMRQLDDEFISPPINLPPSSIPQRQSIVSVISQEEPAVPPPVDNLRSVHSRQASSSSCTSSVGNLGSPKPEKRQANSPLPPTPKNAHYLSNSNLTNTNSIPSGRNSAASVIECLLPTTSTTTAMANNSRHVSRENLANNDNKNVSSANANDDTKKKKINSSKDLEGMYAKVMKKNKFSNVPSQNTSPEVIRKQFHDTSDRPNLFASDPDISKNQSRPVTSEGNQYGNGKDPGYETIPADKTSNQLMQEQQVFKSNRSSATSGTLALGIQTVSQNSLMILNEMEKYCESSEPRYESLPHVSANDPGYETVNVAGTITRKPNSDYDPNYEVLRPTEQNSNDSMTNNYKNPNSSNLLQNNVTNTDSSAFNHVYASIVEENKRNILNNNDISSKNDIKLTNLSYDDRTENNSSAQHHNYSTISEAHSELLSLISSTSQDETAAAVATSVNKTRNSSEHSNLSELKTTPSASDSNSSDLQQIGYNSRRTNNDDSRLTSSNYESLTGSESDPNYESVRYLDEKENPYERLYNDGMVQSPVNILAADITTPTTPSTLSTSKTADEGSLNVQTPSISTPTTTNSDSLENKDQLMKERLKTSIIKPLMSLKE